MQRKKETIDELLHKLNQGVKGFMETDQYKSYLKCLSKFHNYSLNNTILIAMQKPDATLVAGYQTWKQLGRHVKAGEKGIKILAPAFFDFINLQREANRRLGYTAQRTFDYTHSLYEKKIVSYPRTDSRFLTEDMEDMLSGLIVKVEKIANCETTAEKDLKTVINGEKESDHHAIIPTASVDKANLEELPSVEREVLKLIATRLIEAVSTPCRYVETVIDADCNGHQIKVKGKQIIDEGWKAIAPSKESDKDEDNVQEITAGINAGEKLKINSKECKEGKTSEPKSFTDTSLRERSDFMGRLSKYKQGTVINFNAGEQTATVYTRDKAAMRKLDALVIEFPEIYKLVGKTDIDKTYSMPKSCVSYRKPRRLSEYIRNKCREILLANLTNGKLGMQNPHKYVITYIDQ